MKDDDLKYALTQDDFDNFDFSGEDNEEDDFEPDWDDDEPAEKKPKPVIKPKTVQKKKQKELDEEEIEDHYDVANEPIVIHQSIFDLFLEDEAPADVGFLYLFYYRNAKWQKTNTVYSTTGFTAKGLKWSEERVQKVKKRLIQYGLIENRQGKKKKSQKFAKPYVYVKFIWSKEALKQKKINTSEINRSPGLPGGGRNRGAVNPGTNALSLSNINASSLSSKKQSKDCYNTFCESDNKKQSMKEKRLLKKQSTPKKSKKKITAKVKSDSPENREILSFWNKQEGLRKHNKPDAGVCITALNRLQLLRTGKLHTLVAEEDLSDFDKIEWYSQHYANIQIRKGIEKMQRKATDLSVQPPKKDYLTKVSLADAVYNPNSRSSALLSAFHTGIQKIQNKSKKLKTPEEHDAQEKLNSFFTKLGKDDQKTQDQIIDLTLELKNIRKPYVNNWGNSYLMQQFGWQEAPWTVECIIRAYLEFLTSDYYNLRNELQPYWLRPGSKTWTAFSFWFRNKYDIDVITAESS